MRMPWLPQRWSLPGSGLQQSCAVALAATGTFALASLIPFLAAGRPVTAHFPLNLLYAPAWFLFDSFLWFALLIPALCYAYVFVLFSDRVTREVLAGLVAVGFVLPVLSTLAHVLVGTDRALAAVALVAAFGRVPAAVLLILVLMLEGVAGFALLQRWRGRGAMRGAVPDAAAAPATGPVAALAAPAGGSNGTMPALAVPEAHFESPPQDAPEAARDPLEELQRLFPDAAAPGLVNGSSSSAAEEEPPSATAGAHTELPEDPFATLEKLQEPLPDAGAPGLMNGSRPPAAEAAPAGAAASELPPPAPTAAPAAPPAPTTEPLAPTTEPPAPTTEPPAPTTEPPASTAEPPVSTAEPPALSTEAPGESSKPPEPRAGRSRPRGYHVPLEVLNAYEPEAAWQVDNDTREAAATLMATLAEFKIDAEVTGIRRGPVITMFELLPAPGVKISRIVNLADNIALRLAASRVRIVAPIPGKHAVGIEVPNRHRAVVSFREMVSQPQFKPDPAGRPTGVPIVLGKDITGEAQVIDLTATPHLLIAGATGAGKSVLVNALICSVLYSRTPEQVRLLLIDPKIVELKLYNDVPHLLTPVITDPKRAFQALQYCLYEMERRYALLDNLGVRDINSYNRKLAARKERVTAGPLPYLIIVIDEFADLMATTGKELESTLARLAAMARAVGIHIVLATQRPSIDVITGLIKANIPSRIAFMVASKFDSRIIIDAVGAEKLLGRGDMLFVPAWDANPLRIQGALVSEDEVELVTEQVRELGEPDYIDEDLLFDDEESELTLEPGGNDPLMDQALEVVASAGKASASYLQRKLKIGYNRAARLVEEMEHRGIVGPANGSKPREILHLPSRE